MSRIVVSLLMTAVFLCLNGCRAEYDTPPSPSLNILTGTAAYDSSRYATSLNYVEYTDSATPAGTLRILELEATINARGGVSTVKLLHGDTGPDQPVHQVMKRVIDCSFSPAVRQSVPVEATIIIPIYLRNTGITKPSPDEMIPVDEQPVPMEQKQPVYPPEEIAKKVQGVVWLKALVTETGTVGDVMVWKNTSSSPALAAAAVDAIRQWKFKPAVQQKQNVAVWCAIPFRFKLSQ
ncbi:MAG TPA: energy transducer TonB [Bacteroidota bacterium]|nr:energy transducer TonB [Bacteroidota bacterium]